LRNIFPIFLNSEASNRFSFFLIHSKTKQSEAAQKQFLCRFVLRFFFLDIKPMRVPLLNILHKYCENSAQK